MESEGWKNAGNALFSQQNYGEAIRHYSNGLEIEPSRVDLLSNRAAAALQIGLWQKALSDTETVLQFNPTHEKCLFRKIKALWGLNRYEDALNFLQANITNIKGIEIAQAQKLVAQSEGEFRMSELYTLDRETRHDIAEYTGPVEIKPVPGKGRGLVATENLSSGQLVLCCKAFVIVFDKDTTRFRAQNNIKEEIEWSNEDTCGTRVAEKLNLDGSLVPQIQNLYSGEYKYTGSSKTWSENDVMERNLDILKYNAFKSEANAEAGVTLDGSPNFGGLWILPSFLNHSCIDSNAYYQVIGDMMFVRCLKRIRKGEEVTISYWAPTVQIRRKVMTVRNFECDCRSCQLDRREEKEGSQIPTQISKLLSEIRMNLAGNHDDGKNFERVQQIVSLRKGNEALNVALLSPEVEFVGAAVAAKNEYQKMNFILEAMHKVCAHNVFARSSVIQSLNIVRNYLQLEDVNSVRKWWSVFKEDVVAAYGNFKDGVKMKELNLVEEEFAMYDRLASDHTLTVERKK